MEEILLRLRVEDLLFEEAALLDQWKLDEWLALYTEDAHYYVPPTDIPGETADPDTALFYVEFWAAKRLGMKLPANVAAHFDRLMARSSEAPRAGSAPERPCGDSWAPS